MAVAPFENSCKANYVCSVSLSPLSVFEELHPAGTHPRTDDICLEKKKKKLFTFTCFVFLAVWVNMAFNFSAQSHLKRANSICTPSCF